MLASKTILYLGFPLANLSMAWFTSDILNFSMTGSTLCFDAKLSISEV